MNQQGQIWEVKHAGNIPEGRILVAEWQACNYLGSESIRTGISATDLGPAGTFSGHFTINIGTVSTYYVEYYTPSAGVILYQISEIEYQLEADYYLKNPSEEAKYAWQAAAAGVAAGFGFSGGGITSNKYYQLR